jgi:hypothetical protein
MSKLQIMDKENKSLNTKSSDLFKGNKFVLGA